MNVVVHFMIRYLQYFLLSRPSFQKKSQKCFIIPVIIMQFAPNSCNYSNEVFFEKSNMSKEYACLCSLKSDLWEKRYLKKSSSVACDRLCHWLICRHPNTVIWTPSKIQDQNFVLWTSVESFMHTLLPKIL